MTDANKSESELTKELIAAGLRATNTPAIQMLFVHAFGKRSAIWMNFHQHNRRSCRIYQLATLRGKNYLLGFTEIL